MDQDQGLRTETSERPRGDSPLAVSSRRRALDRLRAAVEGGPGAPHPDHRRAGCRQDLAGAPACSPLASLVELDAHRFDEGDDGTRLPAIDRPFAGRPLVGRPRGRTSAAALDPCTTTTSTAGAGCWSSMKPIVVPRSSGTKSRPSSINRVGGAGSRPSWFWAIRSWFGRSPLAGSAASHPAVRLHLHLPPLDLDEARELLKFDGSRSRRGRSRPRRAAPRCAGQSPAGCFASPSGGRRRGESSRISSPDRASRDADPAWPRSSAARTRTSQGPDEPETLEIEQPAPAPAIAAAHRGQSSTGDAVVDSRETAHPRRRGTGGGRMGRRSGNGILGDQTTTTSATETRLADDSSFNEELIEDRYAALQAWSEWTESQKNDGQPRRRGRELALETLGGAVAARAEHRRLRNHPARSSPHRPPRPRAFGPSLSMSSPPTASSSRGSVNQNSRDRGPD